jgi:hypothetical protein
MKIYASKSNIYRDEGDEGDKPSGLNPSAWPGFALSFFIPCIPVKPPCELHLTGMKGMRGINL